MKKILCEYPKADGKKLMKLIEEGMRGFRTLTVLMTAVELRLFDALEKPKGVEELSRELGCDERLLEIFCRALCSLNLLREADGKYFNSEIAEEFLKETSFYSQRTFIMENLRENFENWMKLKEILKSGALKKDSQEFFPERVHSLAQNALLGELQKTVEIVSSLEEFRRARKLLDLGGGHGLYAIAFAAVNEELEAHVFDLPKVLEVTEEYIRRFQAERVKTIPGNFFRDDLGRDYDIIFSSYNPGGKKRELIPKIHFALREGGLYVNKQIFPERDDPLLTLEWNLWNFEGVEKGERLYSFKGDLSLQEYLSELEKNGFEILDVRKMEGETSMIIAKKVR
ncbi:MAG: hypothetical protein PWR13_208 [Archaeoglobi archaeon]|nr:hypothetical protein [Archaeoglobi archaeon]